MNEPPAILTEITASVRRQARKDAAKLLVAAGWDLGGIALVFGISMGTAQDLLPKPRPEAP